MLMLNAYHDLDTINKHTQEDTKYGDWDGFYVLDLHNPGFAYIVLKSIHRKPQEH